MHAAIQLNEKVPGELPLYVPRDIDDGLRAELVANAQRGCFVLLVGGSSVGKTRCAFEAVKTLLPDWWLVHPAGPGEVAALAAAPSARTVVWLDELQRYLDGEHGLTGGVVRALLNAPHPAVIIGTLWPDRYTPYVTVPMPAGADPRAREREVLDLAAVVRIDPEFSPAEQDRARAAAIRDRRLAVAVEAARYGLTQTLAAAPQLVARWQDAKTADPYAWAVLTAALDVARLGGRAPLSAEFLRAAAPGYCTSQQQAEAPDNWLEQALAYATGKLHGAAAALAPAGAGMGRVVGYIPADYLIQHASRERCYVPVPASTWNAILSHVRDPADTGWLADSARNRLLYCYAIPLYRHAADAGDVESVFQLAWRLSGRGDLDGAKQIEQLLWTRADTADRAAAGRLVWLLAERGDLDGLRARADAGDEGAAWELVELLAKHGDLDGLRARADAGDRNAARRLAGLLAKRQDLHGAVQILWTLADAGDEGAARDLVELLAQLGDLDGLRARADVGDRDAARQLAAELALRGDLDELRARADAGDVESVFMLAWELARRGDLDGAKQIEQILRTRADVGDRDAAFWLVRLLAGRGDLDGAVQILWTRADAGDEVAARELADLLAGRGDLDGLRARADADDVDAAFWLAELLAKRGDLDGAKQIEQILRTRADADDQVVARRLVTLLAKRGDLDGAKQIEQILRTQADADDWHAAGRPGGLIRWSDLGDDLDGLRARLNAGDVNAAERLAELLVKKGLSEEAKRLLRFGLNPDGSIASA